jgi:hypothetical protein
MNSHGSSWLNSAVHRAGSGAGVTTAHWYAQISATRLRKRGASGASDGGGKSPSVCAWSSLMRFCRHPSNEQNRPTTDAAVRDGVGTGTFSKRYVRKNFKKKDDS